MYCESKIRKYITSWDYDGLCHYLNNHNNSSITEKIDWFAKDRQKDLLKFVQNVKITPKQKYDSLGYPIKVIPGIKFIILLLNYGASPYIKSLYTYDVNGKYILTKNLRSAFDESNSLVLQILYQ